MSFPYSHSYGISFCHFPQGEIPFFFPSIKETQRHSLLLNAKTETAKGYVNENRMENREHIRYKSRNLSYAQAEKRALTIHKTSQNYNNQFIAN